MQSRTNSCCTRLREEDVTSIPRNLLGQHNSTKREKQNQRPRMALALDIVSEGKHKPDVLQRHSSILPTSSQRPMLSRPNTKTPNLSQGANNQPAFSTVFHEQIHTMPLNCHGY